MIEILTTASIENENVTLFGTLNEKERIISLKFPIGSAPIAKIRDIIYQQATNAIVLDMSGNAYSVYGCKFSNNTIHFGLGAISDITGNFHRVVKERKMLQDYDTVSFSFKDIEKFFPLESFVTTMGSGDGDFLIEKGKDKSLSYDFASGVSVAVESMYKGTYQSQELYNLDISQTKVITITFPTKQSVDVLLITVAQVKQYFEFICNQEILLEGVYFSNVEDKYRQSELVSDLLLNPKTYIKRIEANPYRGTLVDLIKGLEGWLSSFDKYWEVFSIWEKTIYNVNVSPDDLFIWYCQAFELICTLETEIYEKAKEQMAKKQTEPNLKNFMSSVSTVYEMTPNLDAQYFADVKAVRDKLTHHNPKKVVSDEQKKNSYNLIKYFFVSTLTKLLDISGVSRSLCLTAHSKQVNSK